MDPAILKPLDKLPVKHRLFVLAIIQHKGDKTKAARSAGYSPKTCMEQGQQLYRKLQAYIDPLTQHLVQAYALSAEQVVQGLSLLASSDIGDYVEWNAKQGTVTLKEWDTLTAAQRYCIESVKQVKTQFNTTVEFRLAKKQPALDSLAQSHNLYRRVKGSKGLVVVFEEAKTKAEAEKAKVTKPAPRVVHVTFEEVPGGQ